MSSGREEQKQQRRKLLRGLSHASIGIEMGFSVLFGYLIGQWLDEKFGTTWLMPAFTLIGIIAGFRALFRLTRRLAAEAEEEQEVSQEERDGEA